MYSWQTKSIFFPTQDKREEVSNWLWWIEFGLSKFSVALFTRRQGLSLYLLREISHRNLLNWIPVSLEWTSSSTWKCFEIVFVDTFHWYIPFHVCTQYPYHSVYGCMDQCILSIGISNLLLLFLLVQPNLSKRHNKILSYMKKNLIRAVVLSIFQEVFLLFVCLMTNLVELELVY